MVSAPVDTTWQWETGEQARSDERRAAMTRQQNRRVPLPFGSTSSWYRVEQ
jgi:hypothetical protein